MHKPPIRTLSIHKVLEYMGHHAGKSYAEKHAVGFPANLFSMWSKPGIQPEQADDTQQNFLIGKPGDDPQAPLARRCRSAGTID